MENNQNSDQQADKKAGDDKTSKNEEKQENLIPQSRFNEVLDAKKSAEAELSRIKAEQEEAKKKSLEEQGKYKEIADGYEKKAKQFDDVSKWIKAEADAIKATIPEDKKELVPEGMSDREFLTYIRKPKVKEMLFGSASKNIDAQNATAHAKDDGQMTWEKINAMSPEDWAKLTPERRMAMQKEANANLSN